MPLLSLIEDNKNYVEALGIPNVALVKQTSYSLKQVYENILNLRYKIVYLTPERLVSSDGCLGEVLMKLYNKGKLGRFVIDEVHCVSHWG
jgi:superfamily II DNA helicase RecQ